MDLLIFSLQMKLPKLLVQGLAEGDNSRNMQTCNAKCDYVCGVVTFKVTCLDFISLNKRSKLFVETFVIVSSVKVETQQLIFMNHLIKLWSRKHIHLLFKMLNWSFSVLYIL